MRNDLIRLLLRLAAFPWCFLSALLEALALASVSGLGKCGLFPCARRAPWAANEIVRPSIELLTPRRTAPARTNASAGLYPAKRNISPARNSRAYDLAIAFRRVSAEQRLYPLPAYRFGHAARGSRLTNGRQCAILMFGHIKPRRADARTGREEHHGIYDRIDRGHGDCDRYRAGSDLQGV